MELDNKWLRVLYDNDKSFYQKKLKVSLVLYIYLTFFVNFFLQVFFFSEL
jgi:hypothetical protein